MVIIYKQQQESIKTKCLKLFSKYSWCKTKQQMARNCIHHNYGKGKKFIKCFFLFFRNCACAEIMKQCESRIISRWQTACNQHPASQNTSILHINRHTSKLTSSSAGVSGRVKALNLAWGCGFQSQLREKYPTPPILLVSAWWAWWLFLHMRLYI